MASAATDSARLSAIPAASLLSELKLHGATSTRPSGGRGRIAASKYDSTSRLPWITDRSRGAMTWAAFGVAIVITCRTRPSSACTISVARGAVVVPVTIPGQRAPGASIGSTRLTGCRAVSTSDRPTGEGGDDALAEQANRLQVVDVGQRGGRQIEARLADLGEAIDHLLDVRAVGGHVHANAGGLFDLGFVASNRCAMSFEHVELVPGLVHVGGIDVAGVGVLRDQLERLLLAAAADQDPGARLAHRFRRQQRLLELVVLARNGLLSPRQA